MTAMSDEQRRAFLLEGTRTGILSTVDADGAPHAAPIWFTLDGDDVILMTGATSAKGRNLARDGRAALTVDEASFPYAFVLVRGRVELSSDLADLRAWSSTIARRYVGDDRAEEFGARNAVDGELLVRLRPDHVVAEAGVAD